MALSVTKTTGTVYKPIFLKILEDIPGGVTLNCNRFPTNKTELPKGTLIAASSTTGLYQFCKYAKALVSLNTAGTAVRVDKNNLFKVGDLIYAINKKTSCATITRVTNSANTCWIGASKDIGTLVDATGKMLVEPAGAGSTAPRYIPSAVLLNTVRMRNDDLTTLYNIHAAAMVRGTVDESVLTDNVPFNSTYCRTSLTVRLRFA